MIFVTVGSHTQGFDRLVKKMDEIAGKLKEEIVMQIGSSEFKPKNTKYFDFDDFQKMQKLTRVARVVVCHGGAGTIITAMEQGTPVIVIPRLKKYNEALDNHQLELVDALAKIGKTTVVYDIEKLERELLNLSVNSLKEIKKDDRLIKVLKDDINNLI